LGFGKRFLKFLRALYRPLRLLTDLFYPVRLKKKIWLKADDNRKSVRRDCVFDARDSVFTTEWASHSLPVLGQQVCLECSGGILAFFLSIYFAPHFWGRRKVGREFWRFIPNTNAVKKTIV